MTKDNVKESFHKIHSANSNEDNMIEHNQWHNEDNDFFYGEIKAEGLKAIAKKGGLTAGCDIQLLKPYWVKSKSILDVGSGFGRVISALLENSFHGKITGIERNKQLYNYLLENFQDKVKLIHSDIRKAHNINHKFDTILFLWSGLSDFPPREQSQIIKLLSELMTDNGQIIIDTMPVDIKPLNVEELGPRSFCLKGKQSIIRTYEATYQDIKTYAQQSNLHDLKLIKYKTDTNRMRWLYILKR